MVNIRFWFVNIGYEVKMMLSQTLMTVFDNIFPRYKENHYIQIYDVNAK